MTLLDLLRGGAMGLTTDVVGAPVDLATLMMRPFGYKPEKPVGGSDWIAEKMGVGATGSGEETVGRLLSGLVNPATAAKSAMLLPILATKKGGAVLDALKGGKAAQDAADVGKGVSRAKRRVGTTGQYVGAPEGVDSPAAFNVKINDYADRIDQAMKGGVPRGYFYERGTEANRAIARNDEEAKQLALIEGIMSSEAPVKTNTGWAIKAIEQNAMGLPVKSGKYPTEASKKAERVLKGDYSHIGTKTHRYAYGLAGDKAGLAPNDRWELRSVGHKDTATPQQHDFTDEVRKRAAERWSARNPDVPPLSLLEAQELNWVIPRAEAMKITPAQAAKDTIQDSIPAYTFQHSWESRGGEKARHMKDMPAGALPDYHAQVKDVLLDERGKDRLIDAMGGKLQLPAIDGPGVYEGFVAPGTQSRSLVYQTNDAGLDPASAARVNATEMVRAWLLGQDAMAGHSLKMPKGLSGPATDTVAIKTGRGLGNDEARSITDLLNKTYGGNAGIVPTEAGFNVLRFDDNAKFAKQLPLADIERIVGPFEHAPAARSGIYGELGWDKGTATADMLESLNAAPALRGLFDSEKTRGIAGEIEGLYKARSADAPNEKLVNALQVFKEKGIAGVEELVAKGLAPAALLAILAGQGEPQGVQ